MDYIRAYDLNDYALGLSVSASQSPYTGGDDSIFAYPYLTSFRHAAFTNDWFLISDGDVGFRWVNDTGWELGLVGRLQTLGLGNSTGPNLIGLDDRNWGIEIAPMIGWRKWPVHINFKNYWEVLGRHDGTTSELRFSLPHEFDRGYFVPSARAIYRSSEYTNYYYGVSAGEVRPDRLEYQAGSSTGTAFGVSLGYAISDKWLLSGGIEIEYLGSDVSNSPIVDKDRIWSANIGLAYNSNIFQPRTSDLVDKKQPKLEMRITAFADSADAKVIRNAADGVPGDEIDLDDFLGISDSETIIQIETIYRFNDFHRLELGYHELTRTGLTTIDRDVRFGNTTFVTDTELYSSFRSELLRFSYGYSLMNDDQKELGVMAGVHINNSITDILATATGQRERSDVSTPLPVVGLFGSVELGEKSSLGAKINMFAMEYDRLEGFMLYMNLEWIRRFGDSFSAGIAYNFYHTDLESKDSDARGTIRTRHQGPAVFLSLNF